MSDLASPRAAGAVLVGVGALWLLGSLGLFPLEPILGVLAWWPLLAIGVGLDLLHVRRPTPGLPWTAAALIAAAALALLGGGPFGGARERAFSAPLGDARSARVQIDLPSSRAELDAAAGPGLLIDGVARGGVRLDVRSGREARVSLRSRRGLFTRGGPWHVSLAPGLPLELEIDGGSGPAEIDLREAELLGLELDAGSGPVTARLPDGAALDGGIEGGSGSLDLGLGARSRGVVEVDAGSGPVRLAVGADPELELRLSGGSGPLEVTLPDRARVELEVRDDGSGPLEPPPGALRTDDGRDDEDDEDDEGAWLREGGAGVVRIVVVDAGSGPIRFR